MSLPPSLHRGGFTEKELSESMQRVIFTCSPSAKERPFIGAEMRMQVVLRPVVGRTGGPTASGHCRGLEVTVAFDAEKYVDTGAFWFACVLEHFLALYTSINSFTQMGAKNRRGI
ncbi:MAG TPA: type VI secretion system baseplate subunit TssF [Gemmataceae bacterium]